MNRQVIKQLLKILREDAKTKDQLPIIRKLIWSTLRWISMRELTMVLQVLPSKFFIDELSRGRDARLGWVAIWAGAVLAAYKCSAWVYKRTSNPRNSALWRMWRNWWGFGHRCALRLSAEFHTKHSTGEKESLVAKNIGKFEDMIFEFIFETMPVTIRILITSIGVWFIGWQIGVLAVVTSVLYALTYRRTEKAMQPLRKSFRADIKRIERFGSEITSNWATIKASGMEEEVCDRNDALLEAHCESEVERHKKYIKYYVRQEDVLNWSRAALILLLGWMFVHGEIQVGGVYLAIEWMGRNFSNYSRYEDFQRHVNAGMESLKELVGIMLMKPTVIEADSPQWPDCLDGSLEFNNVWFGYPEADEQILQGINLAIKPGETVGIVGPSGQGKSTMLRILMRDYDPDVGSILYGGINLRDMSTTRWRREAVAVVLQQTQLFDDTIAANIRFARPEATDEEVEAAARKANAHDFIVRRGGYGFEVGENGNALSGGERQRIAIARALICQPKILILDEATSSLDAESQALIKQTIEQLAASRECIILIVAHRLSTTRMADTIIGIDGGKIVEQGPPEVLLQQDGLYRRLRDSEVAGLLD